MLPTDDREAKHEVDDPNLESPRSDIMDPNEAKSKADILFVGLFMADLSDNDEPTSHSQVTDVSDDTRAVANSDALFDLHAKCLKEMLEPIATKFKIEKDAPMRPKARTLIPDPQCT